MIIVEDIYTVIVHLLKQKGLRLVLVILSPFICWVAFAFVYSNYSKDLAYVNPYSRRILNPTIKQFFKSICSTGRFHSKVEIFQNGCRYKYAGEGLPTMYGKTEVGYWTREVSFEFKEYINQRLEIKYKILYKWPEGSDRLPEEAGIVYFDMSNYQQVTDTMAFQANPFVSYQNYLIDKIKERPPLDFKKPGFNDFPSWGVILSGGLLKLGSSTGSITSGLKFPIFTVKVDSPAYLNLKRYFEYGEVQDESFSTYLIYSGAIITSLGFTEIIPGNKFLQVLAMMESLIGIILLGIIVGFTYDYAKSDRP
jgi:hypothetical protein